jgi:hypothetical protein
VRGLFEPAKENNTQTDPGISEVKPRGVPDFVVNIILLMRLGAGKAI